MMTKIKVLIIFSAIKYQYNKKEKIKTIIPNIPFFPRVLLAFSSPILSLPLPLLLGEFPVLVFLFVQLLRFVLKWLKDCFFKQK